jgi:hypothetical protein
VNEYDTYSTIGDPASDPFPWPPADGESIIAAAGRTWRGAALEPRRFFSAMPAEAPLAPAIIYYLIIGIAVEGIQLFWAMTMPQLSLERHTVLGAVDAETTLTPVVEFLFSPLLLLLSLFIAAAVVHLLLRLFGGAGQGFGVTTRAFCYCYSPQVLAIIPVVGGVAGFIWMVVIAIIALSAAHGTTTGRAAAAVLLPVGAGLIFLAIAALLVAAGSLVV